MQRVNVYNSFLPYRSDLESDSSLFYSEISANLTRGIRDEDLELCVRSLVDLHKYIVLFGLKFPKTEHVRLVGIVYRLLTGCRNVNPVDLSVFGKIFVVLTKKKYLLVSSGLVLEWRPLYDLYYFWELSNIAGRNLVPSTSTAFKSQLSSVIKYARTFFPDSATKEILEEVVRPLMYPSDQSMNLAMTIASLFLPTARELSPEFGYQLWFTDFMNFWEAWSNSPGWEVELFQLYSRLAVHNVGRIDWEPYLGPIFTKIMVALNLPVTYGGAGLRVQCGLSNSSSSYRYIARWIVSCMGGGSKTQAYLSRLLLAIESYYYPANTNSASEILHSFVMLLISDFINRIHVERHNTKWMPKTQIEKRLTDDEITEFVKSLVPISQHILYSNFEDEKKCVLNQLATLRPHLIIPNLLERFQASVTTLTEPHRFTATLNGLGACVRPLVENYPSEVVRILMELLPGIDVNDIWKCTDIFVLMSDILEMIWLVDFSKEKKMYSAPGFSYFSDTHVFEDFVLRFTDKCLTLVEHSSREQTRAENECSDDSLNDEEIAADVAIGDAFKKIVTRCSDQIFNLAFDRIKRYVQSRILEPTVAGGILAGMCKSTVVVKPEVTLKFFIPHLCERIKSIVEDRTRDTRKQDKELQFVLLLLSEVVNIKSNGNNVVGAQYILPYVETICSTLDLTLTLDQRDDYELASSVLQNLIFNLIHVRVLQKGTPEILNSSPEEFQWGRSADLKTLKLDWYIPSDKELQVVKYLMERYLKPPMEELRQFSQGKLPLEKEKVLRSLRQVYKIVHGASEVLEPLRRKEEDGKPCGNNALTSILSSFDKFNIQLDGKPVRASVYEVIHEVKNYLVAESADDTDSLDTIVTILDVLLFAFGLDEDELNDHMDEHKTIKSHHENRLIRGKRHLESILIDRIVIQHEIFIWLKNIVDTDSLPLPLIYDIFELCIYRYAEVRAFAQELLSKILNRPTHEKIKEIILPLVIDCLKEGVSHEKFKGALYVIYSDKHVLLNCGWKSANLLMPALIKAQHSDKNSIIELLKEISYKVNRTYSDFCLYYMPTRKPTFGVKLREFLDLPQKMEEDDDNNPEDQDFLELELKICDLMLSGTLHWRHYQMAVAMLLNCVTHDHVPPPKVVRLWLDCLIHDDRTIRLVAFQALEAVLKVVKVKRKRVLKEIKVMDYLKKPGIRTDNEWMQYRKFESEAEFAEYWKEPFSTKPHMGYYQWAKDGTKVGEVKLRVVDESVKPKDHPIRRIFSDRFGDPSYVDKFISLNCIEHKKGEDFFSMEKALFHAMLFENFGDEFLDLFLPHIKRLSESSEESDQRASAELVYGVVRGARFWSFEKTKKMWEKSMIPILKKILTTSMTSETISDWETCFSAISNKTDPNRLRWFYELLVDKEQLLGLQGTFVESSFLRLLNKTLIQNWKTKDLYNRTYETVKELLDHPYNKVRNYVARTLATLMTMDNDFDGGRWNTGTGFPKKRDFINEIIPKLNLNCHNPEINNGAISGGEEEENRKKEENYILETISTWLQQYIQISSCSVSVDFYSLLPFLCQFIGVETDQDLSQGCLKALCYLSVCIVPESTAPQVLVMAHKVAKSSSYKAKISLLEFVQVFIFTNFMSLCMDPKVVDTVEEFITGLMSDENLQVRAKASKILCGLLHSKFLDDSVNKRLLKQFRSKSRTKMLRDRATPNGRMRFARENITSSKEKLADYHSGILGLCSIVEAYPYDVPPFVPEILIDLEKHLHDPQPIPKTIKKTLQEFKRTHQDNWQEHKLKFTEDQLLIMTDLLVSPNYYA